MTTGSIATAWSKKISGIESRLNRNQYAPSQATVIPIASWINTGHRLIKYLSDDRIQSKVDLSIFLTIAISIAALDRAHIKRE